jgi:hypothetical protein
MKGSNISTHNAGIYGSELRIKGDPEFQGSVFPPNLARLLRQALIGFQVLLRDR